MLWDKDLISSGLQLCQHLGTHDPDFAGILLMIHRQIVWLNDNLFNRLRLCVFRDLVREFSYGFCLFNLITKMVRKCKQNMSSARCHRMDLQRRFVFGCFPKTESGIFLNIRCRNLHLILFNGFRRCENMCTQLSPLSLSHISLNKSTIFLLASNFKATNFHFHFPHFSQQLPLS